MIRIIAAAIAALVVVVTVSARAEVPRIRVAVLDLKGSGISADVAESLTAVVASELSKLTLLEVISRKEIEQMLIFEEQRQRLGCEDRVENRVKRQADVPEKLVEETAAAARQLVMAVLRELSGTLVLRSSDDVGPGFVGIAGLFADRGFALGSYDFVDPDGDERPLNGVMDFGADECVPLD